MRIPPISPPTCPPQEMPGIANEITRLITINVMALPARRPVSCHSMISIAPRIPKIAPEAPTTGWKGAWMTAPAPPARAAEVLLHGPSDHPQREHVERDVEHRGVEERRREKAPPLVVVREIAGAPEEPEARVGADEDEPVEQRAARRVEPGPLHHGDEVDDDVDPDQDLRDGRVVRCERHARRAPHRPGPQTCRRSAAGDARVVGAADADRRERRTVGADGPTALRAGEPRLAVGMPVAVLRLDGCHPG